MKNNNICWSQIDSQATSFGWQEEHKYSHICIELIYQMYPTEQKNICIGP